jgi:hypothetical protein
VRKCSSFANGLDLRKKFMCGQKRRTSVLELLRTYYLLRNAVRLGTEIMKLANVETFESLASLPLQQRRLLAREIRLKLLGQSMFLNKLHQCLYNKDVIELFEPGLQEHLLSLIGNKNDALYSWGAALHNYELFGSIPEPSEIRAYGEELAKLMYEERLVAYGMTGWNEPIRDIHAAQKTLGELDFAAERFRHVLSDIATSSEMLELSQEAQTRAKLSQE